MSDGKGPCRLDDGGPNKPLKSGIEGEQTKQTPETSPRRRVEGAFQAAQTRRTRTTETKRKTRREAQLYLYLGSLPRLDVIGFGNISYGEPCHSFQIPYQTTTIHE